MELSEFLLARIAEDEAPTWTLAPYDCEPGCCAPAGWVGHQCRYCDAAPVFGGTVEAVTALAEEHAEAIHQRSRVLVECDAKRRIVAAHSMGKGYDESWDDRRVVGCLTCVRPGVDGSEIVTAGPCRTLRALALPYAEHPDYRPEWKP